MATAKITKKVTKSTKTAPKKSTVSPTKTVVAPATTHQAISYQKKITQGQKRAFLAGIVVVIIFALLYVNRSLFIAATVNGEPISRMAVIKDLEKQGGKQAINTQVTKILINQEAKKKNITISSAEISTEMKKIEDSITKQQQNIDDLLKNQGMTRKDLEEQIRTKKLVEKLVGGDIKITDKEIEDYIAQNKDSIPSTMSEAEVKTNVKDQLMQQKLGQKVQTWLADLQKNAKIDYLVNY